MDLETLRERIRKGNYLIKSHAVRYALKEGFDRHHMVEAILAGTIIEEYPNEQRVLVCGNVFLTQHTDMYLHIVCEHADAVYVEFVTAYIPDEQEWEKPPLRRRARRRR